MKPATTPKLAAISKKAVSSKLAAKSSLKEGLGIFKEFINSKPSAWNDDLRCTVKS